jgi:uncharacterized protein (TIGR02466 family)
MIEPTLMFATPIWNLKIDGHEMLNYELQGLIDKFQPKTDYFSIEDAAVQLLKSKVLEQIREVMHWLDWGQQEIILKGRQHPILPGGTDTPHHHPTNRLVAVYYVLVPEKSGDLVMHDPRGSVIWQDPGARTDIDWCSSRPFHKITPTPGSLIIFPGYLVHSVETNLSKEMRLSIALDIYLDDGIKYAQ